MGISLDDAVRLCTHGRRRASSEHDLRLGLVLSGHELRPFHRANGRLPFSLGYPILARVRRRHRRHGYHWIVLSHAFVHDPERNTPVSLDTYERWMAEDESYVTSWAEVRPIRPAKPMATR